jgi:hypothetical protein
LPLYSAHLPAAATAPAPRQSAQTGRRLPACIYGHRLVTQMLMVERGSELPRWKVRRRLDRRRFRTPSSEDVHVLVMLNQSCHAASSSGVSQNLRRVTSLASAQALPKSSGKSGISNTSPPSVMKAGLASLILAPDTGKAASSRRRPHR